MTEPRETVEPAAKSRPPVLLVNVEPRFGEALHHFLEEWGWTVQAAGDPREVLGCWYPPGPPLVVTDLDGAEMDGFELLQELAALDPGPRVLVRVPHAAASRLRGTLERFGVDAVLERPCRLDAAEAALARLSSFAPGDRP